jgi:hypothetical protein
MKSGIATVVRIATGVALVALSVAALRANGWVRWLAAAEIVAALAFCLPRVWRFGGAALLAIVGFAFVHHALGGQFVAMLFFAATTIVMVLAHGRR